MSRRNQHGLSRNIPADIARQVRRKSKFGCVICRSAIVQYEHIEPEFKDAKEHSADNICLLCGGCHYKVTKGLIAKETVQRHYSRIQGDSNVKRPFDQFCLDSERVSVVLGASQFEGTKVLIEIDGVACLAIEPPEEGAAFPTLTGVFYDESGDEVFSIDRNEWSGNYGVWDLVVEGNKIELKQSNGKTALQLIVNPPREIIVQQLNMKVDSFHLILGNDLLEVGRVFEEVACYVGFRRLCCYGAEVGIKVNSEKFIHPVLKSVNISGGTIDLEGVGVSLGVGSQGATLLGLSIDYCTKVKTERLFFPLDKDVFGKSEILGPRI